MYQHVVQLPRRVYTSVHTWLMEMTPRETGFLITGIYFLAIAGVIAIAWLLSTLVDMP